MSKDTLISTALCLPRVEIEALLLGRIIVTVLPKFIGLGRKFALCPTDTSINKLSIEQYYNSNFLSIVENAELQPKLEKTLVQSRQTSLFIENEQLQFPLNYQTVLIKAWAKCELCQTLNDVESLATLSDLKIWKTVALQNIIEQRQNIFLAYLRVYYLVKAIEVYANCDSQFTSLPEPLKVSEQNPILSDRIFAIRKHQLETRQPPPHPEIEELYSAVASAAIANPTAKYLQNDIQAFLGWRSQQFIPQDHQWINDIAALGNRSKEQDEGKSSYQAGTDFENIVRKSLEFLGFIVDYFHKGGAGGVDVFCSQPYPLVIECKAGKKIPNDTAVQLLNIATLRLKNQELIKQSTKLIIGPGEATTKLKDAAKVHNMAIINPETLEKLVKLQDTYHNSVDLFKLKDYLKAGQSDDEVEKYINLVYGEISLRSEIVQLVKKYLENTNFQRARVHSLHGAWSVTSSNKITPKELYEILVELSSPLTGYLGREKGSDWASDRFYFLRDLPIS